MLYNRIQNYIMLLRLLVLFYTSCLFSVYNRDSKCTIWICMADFLADCLLNRDLLYFKNTQHHLQIPKFYYLREELDKENHSPMFHIYNNNNQWDSVLVFEICLSTYRYIFFSNISCCNFLKNIRITRIL